ncbi:MAG: hypothetical protein COU81_01355 [Candidatus Portnoybacteria bacterium CG10_big_fil_rev_8_21_14_0_10_36_7]|uniref:DUF5652 domain-containing protein n=1 Tax=Candidatus Portnoybacteria bacterium CG10_big_fil_rev_8_21_14_0_10_36_7 TaxID=1974812 RepID=A0A2M8KEI3_9BACT|nr:MAG: hypothetical protein COU81_01355 [Candidatus Portnoybacteria bacterium CG10_big_fil_rev_8_21_14_0_10_36_7]
MQWVLVLMLLWTIPFKGVAMWKAATNKDKFWFWTLLIVNTIGILEILYIFWLSKDKQSREVGGTLPSNE